MCWFTGPTITSTNTTDFADLRSKILKDSSFGSWGVGSAGHIAGLELNDFLNVQQMHVPYRDYNQWFVDVSNRDVTYGYATIASSIKMVQSNKIKYVAYLGTSRHPNFPDVPTLHELTKHNFKYTTAWLAFYIHKEVSSTVSSKLEKDIREVIGSNEIQTAMAAMNYRPWHTTSLVDFEKSVADETKSYRYLTKKHNISVN
jgi:tripartite-type tricarboxylate transporter receptor subunit TctC